MALSYRTRKTLRILLPITFWLLAGGGVAILMVWNRISWLHLIYGVVAAVASWGSMVVVLQVDRHQYDASEEAFLSALLIAIASYFCPLVLIAIPVSWLLLIGNKCMDWRAFSASIIGITAAAMVLVPILIWRQLPFPWLTPFALEQTLPLIPTGLFWLCYIGTTIVRKSLRER